MLKDITCLEQIQCRATKFIPRDNFLGYTSRLRSLHLLPFMHWLEFVDVIFLIKCLKNPQDNSDMCSFVTFVKSCTRVSTTMKLQHKHCHLSTTRHFYFDRIVLLWNAMPPVDISQPSLTIRRQVLSFLWDHFKTVFNDDIPCTFYIVCTCANCYSSSHP